jgi:hypothetical protein
MTVLSFDTTIEPRIPIRPIRTRACGLRGNQIPANERYQLDVEIH